MPCAALFRIANAAMRESEEKGGDVDEILMKRLHEEVDNLERSLSEMQETLRTCYEVSQTPSPPEP